MYEEGDMKSRLAGRKKRYDNPNDFVVHLPGIIKGKDKRTTLMIKNIPNKYHQKMMIQLLNETHKDLFDFFYLPIDFRNKCNVGYAFINFVHPIFIVSFYEKFNEQKWPKFNSDKVSLFNLDLRADICKNHWKK